MAKKIRKQYNPNKYKNYRSQLIQMFETDYSFLGCNKTLELMTNQIIELNSKFYPEIKFISPGKVIISAVDKNESKGHHRGAKKLKQVPVQLEILNNQIIDDYVDGRRLRDIKIDHVAGLFIQAFDQGGVLSSSDVALLLKMSAGTISKYAREYMLKHNKPLPTRGFVHDIGPSITHKEIIVAKFLQGKISNEIAKETNHSQEATDRYLRDYERVKICLKKEMDVDKVSHATKLSPRLVNAYQKLYNKYEVNTKCQ